MSHAEKEIGIILYAVFLAAGAIDQKSSGRAKRDDGCDVRISLCWMDGGWRFGGLGGDVDRRRRRLESAWRRAPFGKGAGLGQGSLGPF